MLAQNEVGTVNPIKEIVKVVKRYNPNILVHADCSQALGKVSVNVIDLGVDFATVAGHKLYCPKGVGALFVKRGTKHLDVWMHGGGQEKGQRGGTENIILYAGLGKACEMLNVKLQQGLRD